MIRSSSTRSSRARRGLLAAVTLTAGALIAMPAVAADTVDTIITNDGREFVGQIVEQDADRVVIKTNIAGIVSDIPILRSDILKIVEDEEVEGGSDVVVEDRPVAPPVVEEDRGAGTYGVRRTESAEGIARVMIIPFHGQTGTDIRTSVYEEMVEAIRLEDPDYLVIEVDCQDYEFGLYPDIDQDEFSDISINALDDFRRISDLFIDDLGDIEQVVWVKQAIGMASIVSLAWETIYMHPEALLEGGERAAINFESARNDPDKYGKFREAYMGLLRGIPMKSRPGGNFPRVVDAMIVPDNTLSATWRGRDVTWSLDDSGEYDIDRSTSKVAKFNARTAENFGISAGTASELDDVALLLGLREYAVVGKGATEQFEEYREDWRRTLGRAETAMQDHQQWMSWASGEDWLQYFGKAKKELETVIRCINKYEAVAYRMAVQGVNESGLRRRIKQMEEELAAYRRAARGNRGGRRAPGGGGFGAGG